MFWDLLKAPSVSQDPLKELHCAIFCTFSCTTLHNCSAAMSSPHFPVTSLHCSAYLFSNLVSVNTLVALLVTSLLDSIAVSLFVDWLSLSIQIQITI